jgi:hypothetical protein
MSKYAESVKRVSDYLLENRQRLFERGKTDSASKLAGFADELNEVYDHILSLEAKTSAIPPDLGNIHDLPKELLDELSVAKTDELEDQIVTVINAYGGVATLDQILVGLYRKFNVVQKRRFIQNKLYRMPMVWSVEGRKGVYTTKAPEAVAQVRFDKATEDLEIPF